MNNDKQPNKQQPRAQSNEQPSAQLHAQTRAQPEDQSRAQTDAQPSAQPPAEPLDFEKMLAKLEAIIQAMEEGGQPLETMIVQFEEGMKLVAQCRRALDAAELRVSKLMKDHNTTKLENFDDNDDPRD